MIVEIYGSYLISTIFDINEVLHDLLIDQKLVSDFIFCFISSFPMQILG